MLYYFQSQDEGKRVTRGRWCSSWFSHWESPSRWWTGCWTTWKLAASATACWTDFKTSKPEDEFYLTSPWIVDKMDCSKPDRKTLGFLMKRKQLLIIMLHIVHAFLYSQLICVEKNQSIRLVMVIAPPERKLPKQRSSWIPSALNIKIYSNI